MRIRYAFLLMIMVLIGFNLQIEAKSVVEEAWKDVVQECETVLENSPQDIETRFKLAVAFANLGDLEKTLEEFEKLQEQQGGKLLLEFITKYQKLYEESPDDLLTLNYLAFAYYIAYQFNLSKRLFEQIIELDPEHTLAYNFLALVHGTLSEYDEAIERIGQARKIEDSQFSHLILGLVYYKQGNLVKAMWHIGRSGKLGMGVILQ